MPKTVAFIRCSRAITRTPILARLAEHPFWACPNQEPMRPQTDTDGIDGLSPDSTLGTFVATNHRRNIELSLRQDSKTATGSSTCAGWRTAPVYRRH